MMTFLWNWRCCTPFSHKPLHTVINPNHGPCSIQLPHLPFQVSMYENSYPKKHVCVCIFIFIYTSMYVYVYMYTCIHVCMYVFMYVCMYACMDGGMDGWMECM